MSFKYLRGERGPDDEIIGSLNSDNVKGTDEADVFRALKGDDILAGKDGNDIYFYYRGDGNDIIHEGANLGDADHLQLSDIAFSDITVTREENDLILTVAQEGDGNDDSIRLVNNALPDNDYGVETVAFADGAEMTDVELLKIHSGTQ